MAITRFSGADNSSLAWSTIAPAAGDLVLLLWANDGGDSQSGLSDFTRLNSNTGTQTGVELGIYYRICTGSESGNIFTSESAFGVTSEEYAWHALKVPAGEWHGTTPPEISTIVTASSGTPNPDALAPSWGAEADTVFVVVLCRDDNDGIGGGPTNYDTNFLRTEAGANGPEIATSWRVPSPHISSEDPDAWTVTGTAEEYITHTIAIRPVPRPAIASIDSDNDTIDTRTGVEIAGENFGASQTGSAKVEISDNAIYGSGTVVEIDATSWSATSITATLRQESDSAALGTLLTLPLSPAWLWVTDSSGNRNAIGFQFTLRPPGPTAVEAANTPATLAVDTIYLVRVRIENAGGPGPTGYKWQYNHEGGGWTDISTTSDVVQAAAAASFADDDDVPEVLGGSGAYSEDNAAATEDGTTSLPGDFPALGAVEFVLAFQIVGDDVADADEIQLRLVLADGTPLDSYSNTPTITVEKVLAGTEASFSSEGTAGASFGGLVIKAAAWASGAESDAAAAGLAEKPGVWSAGAQAGRSIGGQAAGAAVVSAAAAAAAALAGLKQVPSAVTAGATATDIAAGAAQAGATVAAAATAGDAAAGQASTAGSMEAAAEADAAAAGLASTAAQVSASATAAAAVAGAAARAVAFLAEGSAGDTIGGLASAIGTITADASAAEVLAGQAATAAQIIAVAEAGDAQDIATAAIQNILAAAEAGEEWAAQAQALAALLAEAGADGTVAGLSQALAVISASAEASAAFASLLAGSAVAFSSGSAAAAQFVGAVEALAVFADQAAVADAMAGAATQAAAMIGAAQAGETFAPASANDAAWTAGAQAGAVVSGKGMQGIGLEAAADAAALLQAVTTGRAFLAATALAGASFEAEVHVGAAFTASALAGALFSLPPEVRRVVGTISLISGVAAGVSLRTVEGSPTIRNMAADVTLRTAVEGTPAELEEALQAEITIE